MTKFMKCGIDSAMVFINKINIPDMHFKLDLGVIAVDFALTDMRVRNVLVDKIFVSMYDSGIFDAGANDINLELGLNW